MQTNNRLIKQICENYNITVEGTHSDNYYLRKIATEKFNCSYSELESNNKYLKDIAEAITGGSYSEPHFDNFYLKKIAEFLSSETYMKNFDNFYLKIWANGDVPPTPPTFDGVSLSVDESTIGYGESVTLAAQLTSDGSRVSISGETVSFYDGETLIGSEDTDSTGVATFTSSNFDVGSHSVTGVCDEYTSNSVSVTVNKLPLEYQEVEYIENTGTSYIDTGFKPNNNTRTYIMFYAGTLGTNVRAIFGSRDDTTYNHSYTSFYLGSNTTSTGRMRVDYYNANSNNIYLFPNTSDKTEYELDYNKNIVTLNGATHTFTPQTFNSNNNIFLFTCNSGGIADNRMMIGKIYACKIWDNEVLIRDLIPCYRISDNVIGLYDIVNAVFYTNSGTGTFSKGADV